MPSSHETDHPQRHLSRRSVAKGVAWSAPAVATVAASPAMAASRRQVTTTVTADRWNATVQTVTIPANASGIRFTVMGGGGGTYTGPLYAETGGSGALVRGSLQGCGQPITLWVVAGGGGVGTAYSRQSTVRATGYGNGGASITVPDSSGLFDQSAQGWTMGGGAGSATDGNGGTAGSGDGQQFTVTYVKGQVNGFGGKGAQGAIGGAAGAGGPHTVASPRVAEAAAGSNGGNNGTGNFGGGDGGDPVRLTTEMSVHHFSMRSAAGGGGYAGGGSSGLQHVGADDLIYGSAGLVGRNAIAGTLGGGGAGSNFVGGSTACVSVVNPTQSTAGNGGRKTANQGNGGPGQVTISYSVPL